MHYKELFFGSKQAAEYLTQNGVQRTVSTLETLRVRGGGPRFRKVKRQVIYAQSDLDNYISSLMSDPMASTSDKGRAA
ncbi:hypothetical protein WV31_05545 [Magnetospirillum sp. ME-1]|nr:hypothetical protein WV31_05545 [Magnetospirillum sp. ME-1]